MTYKSLKLLIVVATFFVWVRLFVGAVETLNSATAKALNKSVVVTENTH